jgi:hypothetical protein
MQKTALNCRFAGWVDGASRSPRVGLENGQGHVVARRTIDKVDRSEGGAICLDVRFSPCHKAITLSRK